MYKYTQGQGKGQGQGVSSEASSLNSSPLKPIIYEGTFQTTVVCVDWDNTIFCTHWLKQVDKKLLSLATALKQEGITIMEREVIRARYDRILEGRNCTLDRLSISAFRFFSRLISRVVVKNICLVTNGTSGWAVNIFRLYMPRLEWILSGICIRSARSLYETRVSANEQWLQMTRQFITNGTRSTSIGQTAFSDKKTIKKSHSIDRLHPMLWKHMTMFDFIAQSPLRRLLSNRYAYSPITTKMHTMLKTIGQISLQYASKRPSFESIKRGMNKEMSPNYSVKSFSSVSTITSETTESVASTPSSSAEPCMSFEYPVFSAFSSSRRNHFQIISIGSSDERGASLMLKYLIGDKTQSIDDGMGYYL